MKLEQIQKYAEQLKRELELFCSRIEIAGSIRRRKPDCKDIELVVIQHPFKLYQRLKKAEQNGYIIFKKNGPKYKQFTWCGLTVDLFIATPQNWGLIFLIRTGSKEFNEHWITAWKARGGTVKDGVMKARNGFPVDTKEEQGIFDALGIEFIEPEKRI